MGKVRMIYRAGTISHKAAVHPKNHAVFSKISFKKMYSAFINNACHNYGQHP